MARVGGPGRYPHPPSEGTGVRGELPLPQRRSVQSFGMSRQCPGLRRCTRTRDGVVTVAAALPVWRTRAWSLLPWSVSGVSELAGRGNRQPAPGVVLARHLALDPASAGVSEALLIVPLEVTAQGDRAGLQYRRPSSSL